MANAIKLPSFKDSHCFYLEVCGKLRRARAREERSQRIARVRTARGAAYLRLLRGGNPAGHLHVDLALARFFPKSIPEISSTRGEIEQEIAAHFGETVDVFIFAQYATALQEIPPGAGVVFAGPSAVVSTINNTAVEVGGAHLVLRNEGFVRTIDWQIVKEDTVFSDILSHCETQISPSYIVDLFARMEAAHAAYILGRTVNASPQP